MSDATLLAKTLQQPGDLRGKDAKHSAEQGHVGRHREPQVERRAEHPLPQRYVGQHSIRQGREAIQERQPARVVPGLDAGREHDGLQATPHADHEGRPAPAASRARPGGAGISPAATGGPDGALGAETRKARLAERIVPTCTSETAQQARAASSAPQSVSGPTSFLSPIGIAFATASSTRRVARRLSSASPQDVRR